MYTIWNLKSMSRKQRQRHRSHNVKTCHVVSEAVRQKMASKLAIKVATTSCRDHYYCIFWRGVAAAVAAAGIIALRDPCRSCHRQDGESQDGPHRPVSCIGCTREGVCSILSSPTRNQLANHLGLGQRQGLQEQQMKSCQPMSPFGWPGVSATDPQVLVLAQPQR